MIPIPKGVQQSVSKYYRIQIIEWAHRRMKLRNEGTILFPNEYTKIAKNHLQLHLVKLVLKDSKNICSMYIKGWLKRRY